MSEIRESKSHGNKAQNMLVNALCLYSIPEVIKLGAMFSGLTEVLQQAISGFVSAVSEKQTDLDLLSFFDDEMDELVVDVVEQLHEQSDALFEEYAELLQELGANGKLEPAVECIKHFSTLVPDLTSLDQPCRAKTLLGYLSFMSTESAESNFLRDFIDCFGLIFRKIEQEQQREAEQEEKDAQEWFAAADSNDVNKLVSLLSEGIDIELKDKQSRTALAYAVISGNLESVNILLAHGAIPVASFSGDSPIAIAIEENKPDIVAAIYCSEHESLNGFDWKQYIQGYSSDYITDDHAELIQHLISFNAEEVDYHSIAEKAIKNDANSILEILLDAGLDANDDSSSTPLTFIALEENNQEALTALFEQGADANATNWHKETLLEKAINNAPLDMIELLISHDAKLGLDNHAVNEDLLRKLSESKNCTMGEVLKLELFDPAAYDRTSRSFLHVLVYRYDADDELPADFNEIVSCLIEDMGVDINQLTDKEHDYDTALSLAQHEAVFDCLLQHKPDLDLEFNNNETIFDKVKSRQYQQYGQAIVRLLKAGINPDMSIDKQPLIHYCLNEYFSGEGRHYLDAIFEQNVDLNAIDKNGYTVLQKWISDKDLIGPYLKRFAENGADFSLNTKTGLPLVHALCANYDTELVKEIVDITDIDISVSDENDNNAIMQACLARNIPNIIFLTEAGVDVDQMNKLGGTALLHAVYAEDVELIKILLNQCGADASVELAGKSLQFIAYHLANYDAWEMLREHNAA